jgi:hypothetical protein
MTAGSVFHGASAPQVAADVEINSMVTIPLDLKSLRISLGRDRNILSKKGWYDIRVLEIVH